MRSRVHTRARAAIGVALLILGLAVVGPASAEAKVGGSDRPVRGTVSGTIQVNLQNLAITVEASGVSTHNGRFTTTQEGFIAIGGEGTTGSGTQTIVSANGDRLEGTFTLSTPGLPTDGHTTTVVTTITGGTGRFSDASGTLVSKVLVTPLSLEGVTLINTFEGTTRGRISY